MLRKSLLALMLLISPFSFSSSGGVSDGGVEIPTEVQCEFKDSSSTFLFSVLAPPYDLPSGSGNNSVLLHSIEIAGQDEVRSAENFQTSRRSLQTDQNSFIIYSDAIPGGVEVSVETRFISLSQDERSKLKSIRKDIDWAGYSKAILSIEQRNLNLSGICVFRQ